MAHLLPTPRALCWRYTLLAACPVGCMPCQSHALTTAYPRPHDHQALVRTNVWRRPPKAAFRPPLPPWLPSPDHLQPTFATLAAIASFSNSSSVHTWCVWHPRHHAPPRCHGTLALAHLMTRPPRRCQCGGPTPVPRTHTEASAAHTVRQPQFL